MTPCFTPGAYLKYRRTAAGFAIEDVAAKVATDPHLPELGRVEWLKLIEADAAPLTLHTVLALRQVFRFDLRALERLVAVQLGFEEVPPVLCRTCACCFDDPCDVPGASGCFPSENSTCSRCEAIAAGIEPGPWTALALRRSAA